MCHAERLSKKLGGAQIWIKREDLAHTGAHKINNAIGQVLLAKKLGKKRIIAETGAGQHGVATATACALLGLECIVYMGQVDCERQALNVFRMRTLGARVVPVTSGSKTLKEPSTRPCATVANVETTHYIIECGRASPVPDHLPRLPGHRLRGAPTDFGSDGPSARRRRRVLWRGATQSGCSRPSRRTRM